MEFIKDNHLGPQYDHIGTLFYAVNSGACRYTYSIRAGSGKSHSDNQCARNVGPLPDSINGVRTNFKHIRNRTKGHIAIRGYVWDLENMKCQDSRWSPGWRTGLFVHSSGDANTRWSHENEPMEFETNGCIKIRQSDRKAMAHKWDLNVSHRRDGNILVRHP